MSSDAIFPFLPNNAGSPPQVFPYSVVINDAFPSVQFIPTEPNGQYQEITEVDGSWWFVTNATWNPNLLQWDQESNQNTTLPAYAFVLDSSGSMSRYESPATTIPNTPITWHILFNVVNDGTLQLTPLPLTTNNQSPHQETQVWSGGTGLTFNAEKIHIVDTASAANSTIQDVDVNGNVVWQIDKTGTLIVGHIPFARISGFSPVFNNATFTGTTTFSGPVNANDGLTVAGGLTADTATITGALSAGSITTTGGGNLSDSPTFTTAGFVVPAVGSAVSISIKHASFFPIGTTVIVQGASSSGTTSMRGYVITSSPTSLSVQNASMIQGAVGDTIFTNATVSYSTVNQILTSSDGNLAFTNTGTALVPAYGISFTNPYPAPTTASYTIPAVGASGTVSYRFADGFPQSSYIWINGPGGTSQVLGKITGNSVSGGITTSTFTCLEVPLGSSGLTVGAGALVFNASYDPALPGSGAIYRVQIRPNQAGPFPQTTTLTLPTLPGTTSNNYTLYAHGSVNLSNSGTSTLAGGGTGATWESSNTQGDAGTTGNGILQYIDLAGTATGGTSPSATWTITGVGVDSNPTIGVFLLEAYAV